LTTALAAELPTEEVDRGGFEPPTRGSLCDEVSLIYASLSNLMCLERTNQVYVATRSGVAVQRLSQRRVGSNHLFPK